MLTGIPQNINNTETQSGRTSLNVTGQNYTQPDSAQQTIPAITPEDTSSTRIYFKIPAYQEQRNSIDELYTNNFLLVIPHKTISQEFDTSLLTKYKIPHKVLSVSEKPKAIVKVEKSGFEGRERSESSLDWIPLILLLTLFIFSWMKILYQKYIFQVISGIINYQASVRLYRERNVLFQNMSIGLNLIFSLNVGLLIFFFIQYFKLPQVYSNDTICIAIYNFGIILIINIKTVIIRIIGYLFQKQDEFHEYVHNINLYNKNIGLFLFPVVILFPYIADQIKPAVIWAGLLIWGIMILFRTIRGFQIIIRKEVSPFYLILYLCTVEILPVLILIKLTATLI
ncbi:MAG: DUF4271 domain-containing protein [Bacteroidota bacterium]|nr:DUF4271 domain-containing protein [Bacteroidota bacterium]